ncbi:MAG: hypothetical protein GYB28_01520 [Gammaproteobacteria bacterium]|uniref:PDZ domain-containing protein n=1 Tax=Vreelandella venusta TaxID=44935 RepID=A0ABX2BD64_9GAMM|nr:hypothetical protein [Halomonas venusta]AZM95885.1 hypothetical protein EI420_09385 [Halomonas venusta]MBR9923653.1 hypothetical protein [Gammaproteobacteria bacterium]NPT30836.1 hypothetical protein [Halomonas venusta]
MTKAPDRERWIGWVALAWIIAGLAVIGGIMAISSAGFIEVPRSNGFGRMETVREPNVFIWAIAIGQAVSAAMLAAIFSMINSIYQNSCDQLAGVVFDTTEPDSTQSDEVIEGGEVKPTYSENDYKGLKVLSVHRASPLSGLLKAGFVLISINNKPALTDLGAAKAVVKGKNTIEFLNAEGVRQAYSIRMEPGPLHIKFEK